MRTTLKMASIMALLGLLSPLEADAGLVTASINPGATAYVAWRDVNSAVVLGQLEVFDADQDGKIQFVIPQDAQDRPGLLLALCWPGNFGGGISDVAMQGTESFSAPLSAFEPFRFATFSAKDVNTRMVSRFVVDQLIADGGADALFDTGETFSITNGVTARTSAFIFHDGSSLSDDPEVRIRQLLDIGGLDALPLFTGDAVVESGGVDSASSLDTFAPIPEPATLPLVGGALLALLACARPAHHSRRQLRSLAIN
jgi:hypothetical protein